MRRILKTLFWGVIVFAFAWLIASLPGRVSFDAGPYTVETSVSLAVTWYCCCLSCFMSCSGWCRWQFGCLAQARCGAAGGGGGLAIRRSRGRWWRWPPEKRPTPGVRRRGPGRFWAIRRKLCCCRRKPAGSPVETTRRHRHCKRWRTRKDSAFLGLRGLMANAITRQNWTEAAALARQAEAAHPGAAWLRHERAQLAIRSGDWAEALTLSGPDAPRAALAVGAAQAEANPDRAERLARQALKADPSFTPAVLTLAGQLRARGREKNALAVLADGWKRAPHPDIAAMALAPVTDKLERAKVAQQLTAGAPDHPETHLLLARTALDAGVVGEARRHLEAAQTAGFDQRRLWLLMAELEEDERGDTEAGRMAQRDALRRAASADPDPEWRCAACHTSQAVWRAACPVCLAPGSLSWRTETVHGGTGTQVITQAA